MQYNAHYNYKDIKAELIGVHAMNAFMEHNSASRSVMFASHNSQRLPIIHGTENYFQTGAEKEFAKYTFSVKMPANGRIIQVVDRYPVSEGKDSIPVNPESFVIYEDEDTLEIGCLTVPGYISHHQYFGYELVDTDHINKLYPGNRIEKGTIFKDAPTVGVNGGYKYGRMLNGVFMSHPGVAEDGIVICEDVLPLLEFDVFERRVVEFGKNTYPVNVYGTPTHYKPFPEIGEEVHPTGILMALRDMEPTLAPIDMSIYDLCTVDHTFDRTIYGRGGKGVVVDIKLYHNEDPTSPTPSGMMDGMDKYGRALRRFYEEILSIENRLRYEYRKKTGYDKLPMTPEFHKLVVEALAILDKGSGAIKQQPLNLEYRRNALDDYRIEFVIKYRIRPNIGFKLSDLSGGKGVICGIEKRENMPIDKDGNSADFIADGSSVVARTNLARMYSPYFGAALRDVCKDIIAWLGIPREREYKVQRNVEALYQTNPAIIDQSFNHFLRFLEIVSEPQYRKFSTCSIADRLSILTYIVTNGIYEVFWPSDNQVEADEAVTKIQQFRPPTYGPVSYVGYSGKRVTTKASTIIGPMMMILLEKISDDWSSVSSGKLQLMGVLSPLTKSEKYTKPWHNSPLRGVGETEARIYAAYCGRYAVAELMDRANNPIAHKFAVKRILESKQPTNIPVLVDRNVVPFGGSKPLQLFMHFAICDGWRPVYEPEENHVIPPAP